MESKEREPVLHTGAEFSLRDACAGYAETIERLFSHRPLPLTFNDTIRTATDGIETSISNLSCPPDKQIAIDDIRNERRYYSTENNTGLCYEAVWLHNLAAYVIALAPSEWKQACRDLEIERVREATAIHLHVCLGKTRKPLSILFGGPYMKTYKRTAEANIRSIFPDEADPLVKYVEIMNEIGLIVSVSKGLNILNKYKHTVSTAQYKQVQSMARKLSDLLVPESTTLLSPQSRTKSVSVLQNFQEFLKHGIDRISVVKSAHLISEELKELKDIFFYYRTNLLLTDNVLQQLGKQVEYPEEATEVEGNMNIDDELAHNKEVDLALGRSTLQSIQRSRQAAEQARQQEISHKMQELAARLNDCNSTIEDYNSPWRISRQEIKNRELLEVTAALIKGYSVQNESGNSILVLPGRTKAEARALVGFINGIASIAEVFSSPRQLDELVERWSEQELRMHQQVELIINEAQSLPRQYQESLRNQTLPIQNVSKIISDFRDNWDDYSRLIIDLWPDGERIASNIQKIIL